MYIYLLHIAEHHWGRVRPKRYLGTGKSGVARKGALVCGGAGPLAKGAGARGLEGGGRGRPQKTMEVGFGCRQHPYEAFSLYTENIKERGEYT